MVTLIHKIEINFNFNPFTTTVLMYIGLRHTLVYCLSVTHTCKFNTHKRTPHSSTNVHMYINPFTTEYMPIHVGHSWELKCISIECHIGTPLSIKYQILHS